MDNKPFKVITLASALFVSACSSDPANYNYDDSNPDFSAAEGYYPGTLTEFVAIYQEMRDKGCKRYTNDPTYVYTCDTESLTITNMGIKGRLIKFCAHWGNKEYCSLGSNTRW